MPSKGAAEKANTNWGSSPIVDSQGNAMRTTSTVNSSSPNPTYVGSGGGNGSGPDPFVDIGKLETHVSWLTKGLIGLAIVSAGILGWLIVNLYTPMHDIATNVAVLSSTTGDLKSDVGEIKKQVEDAVVNSRLKAGASDPLPGQPASRRVSNP